jgi:hypothetical protein
VLNRHDSGGVGRRIAVWSQATDVSTVPADRVCQCTVRIGESPHAWALATPFPPTLAPYLLGQMKLEKNCLANGTRSRPHGFSPFTVIAVSITKGGEVLGLFSEFPLTSARTNCS